MHSVRNSINKRLYTLRLKNNTCRKIWSHPYWQEKQDVRIISCRNCPKLSVPKTSDKAPNCSIPFGTPIRQCSTAAQEANLHSLQDKDLLEIGFGKHSIPRTLVKKAGGSWTGIEPTLPKSTPAKFGQGGYGHVADLPFPDASFDVVTGIQSLEHWAEPLPGITVDEPYTTGLKEIFRVLKPKGFIYFDAPIHLHGHEMFIAGDIERIRALFDTTLWQDIIIEKWREDYAPLHRYPTPPGDMKSWETSVSSYPQEQLRYIRENASVWLMTIKARKRD